jgi:hypothetical protein
MREAEKVQRTYLSTGLTRAASSHIFHSGSHFGHRSIGVIEKHYAPLSPDVPDCA